MIILTLFRFDKARYRIQLDLIDDKLEMFPLELVAASLSSFPLELVAVVLSSSVIHIRTATSCQPVFVFHLPVPERLFCLAAIAACPILLIARFQNVAACAFLVQGCCKEMRHTPCLFPGCLPQQGSA